MALDRNIIGSFGIVLTFGRSRGGAHFNLCMLSWDKGAGSAGIVEGHPVGRISEPVRGSFCGLTD